MNKRYEMDWGVGFGKVQRTVLGENADGSVLLSIDTGRCAGRQVTMSKEDFRYYLMMAKRI